LTSINTYLSEVILYDQASSRRGEIGAAPEMCIPNLTNGANPVKYYL